MHIQVIYFPLNTIIFHSLDTVSVTILREILGALSEIYCNLETDQIDEEFSRYIQA